MAVSAQTPEVVTVKVGQRRSAAKGRLKIKFLSVEEDSRCPEGANCIWAGNVKIKIALSGKYETKNFEINTALEPKVAIMDCWSVEIESVAPAKTADKATDAKAYEVKLKVTKLQR
jgi:hypothetical protein